MKEVSQRIAMHLEIAIAQVVVEMIAVIQVRQNVKVNYFEMEKQREYLIREFYFHLGQCIYFLFWKLLLYLKLFF